MNKGSIICKGRTTGDSYSKPEISHIDWDGSFLRIRVDDEYNFAILLGHFHF